MSRSITDTGIAVVGATGVVGETLLALLAERGVPRDRVSPLASARSAGRRVAYGRGEVTVGALEDFDFRKAPLVLASAGASVSARFAPAATAAGSVIIDNTSCFRYDQDVPLVVPEVNPEALAGYTARRIVANPNCSTIQMVVALKPIHDRAGIERINVATYQAVSGAGRRAAEELHAQTVALLNFKEVETSVFPRQIAFNVLPHIDEFQPNGYTREEMKMVWETRKILGDESIQINATAVRVPVFFGHGAALHIETRAKMSAAAARDVLAASPGIRVLDRPEGGGYPTPVTDASGTDLVHVGRIRDDISHPRGLDLWVVSDNVRKGAAVNAVQIAELLLNDYL